MNDCALVIARVFEPTPLIYRGPRAAASCLLPFGGECSCEDTGCTAEVLVGEIYHLERRRFRRTPHIHHDCDCTYCIVEVAVRYVPVTFAVHSGLVITTEVQLHFSGFH